MIVMDLATRLGKLWFQQDFFQVCGGFQLVRFQNHDKTSLGTIANISVTVVSKLGIVRLRIVQVVRS